MGLRWVGFVGQIFRWLALSFSVGIPWTPEPSGCLRQKKVQLAPTTRAAGGNIEGRNGEKSALEWNLALFSRYVNYSCLGQLLTQCLSNAWHNKAQIFESKE